MLDINLSKEIFLRIYPNEHIINDATKYILTNAKAFEKYIAVCNKNQFPKLYKLSPYEKLCITIAYLPIVKAKYASLNISDDIFYDTMSDIAIWIDDYKLYNDGKIGLQEFNWIRLHLSCQIFKLGRLQFHLANYYYSAFCKRDNVSIKLGDKCLNLHIPRGERLSIESCQDSFNRAKVFFSEHFTDYPTNVYDCHSWILYTDNGKFMDKSSNLMQFASLFETATDTESPSDTIRYIFNILQSDKKLIRNRRKYGYYIDLSNFTPTSSLQQRTKDYIMQGGKLGINKGQIII